MKLTSKIFVPHNDGKPNLNGRIYTPDTISEMVKQFNDRKSPMLGELGYPDNMDKYGLISNPSHEITNIREEDGNLIGDIEILNTPSGNILKELIEETVFRPRLTGEIDKDGIVNVHSIISFDAVPKSNDAFNEEDFNN